MYSAPSSSTCDAIDIEKGKIRGGGNITIALGEWHTCVIGHTYQLFATNVKAKCVKLNLGVVEKRSRKIMKGAPFSSRFPAARITAKTEQSVRCSSHKGMATAAAGSRQIDHGSSHLDAMHCRNLQTIEKKSQTRMPVRV
jgi:hypothetical protein